MNKMMLKMLADFLGLEPDDIRQMMLDGHASISDGLRYMQLVNLKLDLIIEHLGIVVPDIDGNVIEHKERIENVENEST